MREVVGSVATSSTTMPVSAFLLRIIASLVLYRPLTSEDSGEDKLSLSVRACLPLTQTLPRHTTLQGSTLSPASESRCVRFGRGRLRVPLRCWHYRSFTQDGGYRAGGCTRCHHAPLSTLLLSTVHPVVLYTPSQAPSHCKQRAV
jgi:hypothetical protein